MCQPSSLQRRASLSLTSFHSSGLRSVSPAVCRLSPSLSAAHASPLVEVVVILRPLNVDEFLVLLLVSFPTRDGKVLHVLQGLPQRFHRFRCYLDHHTVYGWKEKKPRYGVNPAKMKSERRRTFTGISLMVCDNAGLKKDFFGSKCKAQERPLKVCIFHIIHRSSSTLAPSTMLVLARKPDEVFKAPLNTKKQAPVTARNTEKGELA